MGMIKAKVLIKCVIWILIISVGLFFYSQFSSQFNTMEVGFYGVPEEVEVVLSNWLDERNIDWKPVIFDDTIPLEDQLSAPVKQNILFTVDGMNMDSVAPYARTAKTRNLVLMPIPIRTSVQTDSRLTATPILLDHFQLSYNVESLRNMGSSIPTNFIDLESVAQSYIGNRQGTSSVAPILCAGGNDDDLIQFFSAMLETMHGIDNYDIAQLFLAETVASAKKNELLSVSEFNAFFELPQVYDTLQYISTWEIRGFLSSSWLNLSRDDILRAMENKSALFTFVPFSSYENLSQGAKSAYAPWFMPSGSQRESRYLIAPAVVVMEFSYVKSPFQSARQSAKKNNLASSLIEELVSGLVQSQLSTDSNLTPVNASAVIDEMGAGETRQLFSLSDGITPDIAQASFVRQSDRTQFAQALRMMLLQIEEEM